MGDLHQARERDAIGAVLVLLHLLEGYPASFSQRFLGDLQSTAAEPDRRTPSSGNPGSVVLRQDPTDSVGAELP
jgi:hypothetical protein